MAESIADIEGVGPATEDKLAAAGVVSLQDLADAEVEVIVDHGITESKAEDLIQRAAESVVTVQSSHQRAAEYDERENVTTGIDELDDLLGGGLEEEAIVAAYGRNASGKTQVAFNVMTHAVEQTGESAVYIETERDRFRPERLEQLAPNEDVLDDIYSIRAYSLDEQLNAYGTVMNNFDDVSVVVVDSFTGRFRLSERFDGRASLGERAEEFRKHLNAIEELAAEKSCPVYLSCQISGNPDQFSSDERLYGSTLFSHTATCFLHLTPSGDLREVELENHPSLPEDTIAINITESGIVGIGD